MTSFFPEDKDVPNELIFDNIKIRQLRSTDNDLDYIAVIESGFRPEGFPKEENLEQISRHEKHHNEKKEFAYTILDKDETVCYGCIFINPVAGFLKYAFFNDNLIQHLGLGETDPGINFWITPKAWEMGFFEKILEKLVEWFKSEWPYETLSYLGIKPHEKEIKEVEKLSKKEIFHFRLGEDKYFLWKLI